MANRVQELTGVEQTGRFGMGATDLGTMRKMANGEIISVFGDTFDGRRVGEGAWRSPVGLIGNLDASGKMVWDRAAGKNPNWAEQFWDYPHNNPEFSTVLPSDIVVLPDGAIILHVMVNKGLGNVVWTELWVSRDNGVTWQHLGPKFDAHQDGGMRQMWTMEYDPKDGYVYIMSSGFQRDKGLILYRVNWERMNDPAAYEPWHWDGRRWLWGRQGQPASVIWGGRAGEMSLRIVSGTYTLTIFDAGAAHIATWMLPQGPTTDMRYVKKMIHAVNGAWHRDGQGNICSQLYGGYVVPGSELNRNDKFQVCISQWNTQDNFPYRSLLYRGRVDGPVGANPQPSKVEGVKADITGLLGGLRNKIAEL